MWKVEGGGGAMTPPLSPYLPLIMLDLTATIHFHYIQLP